MENNEQIDNSEHRIEFEEEKNIKEKILFYVPAKKTLFFAGITALILVFIFYAYQACDAYKNVKGFNKAIIGIEKSILEERDIKQAKEHLEQADLKVESLKENLRAARLFSFLPFVNREVSAAKDILSAASITIESGFEIIEWLSILDFIEDGNLVSYNDFSDDEKKEFLQSLVDSVEIWNKTRDNLELSILLLRNAQKTTNIPVVSNLIVSVAGRISKGMELSETALPWISAIPDILGYPESKTYLLLLKNNTELRPTGGFIGTFGIVTLSNGGIEFFETDNVYNLDEPAKAFNEKIPPDPIRKYLKQSQWFFRDSNWDPDFPSSAKSAIQFYKDQKGPIEHFDGVLAFTPKLIEDLISIVGPIEVGDIIFTSETLVDLLAYHVELGFKEEGINEQNRKQIIDELATTLKDRLFSLNFSQIRAFVPKIIESLEEKHFMVYFVDSKLQAMALKANWDNRIKESDFDYLYVVDANLGSLKSDPAMERTISYSISSKDSKLIANVSIEYKHTGTFDWKTTRYRTYTRVYVPLGSKLIKAEGNMENVSVYDEHKKTVFGTFISIEPGATKNLLFSYELPEMLYQKIISKNYYSIFIQKQAGTYSHKLKLNFNLPFNSSKVSPNIFNKLSGANFIGEWNLEKDRLIYFEK